MDTTVNVRGLELSAQCSGPFQAGPGHVRSLGEVEGQTSRIRCQERQIFDRQSVHLRRRRRLGFRSAMILSFAPTIGPALRLDRLGRVLGALNSRGGDASGG